MLISVEGTGKNQLEPDQEWIVVMLFFAKTSLSKTDRSAEALS
jgi:hypothetical protein